jgi:hypothetical protein
MLLLRAVLSSLDSLAAGCAFGALLGRRSSRLVVAAAFGVADGAGSMLGGLLSTGPRGLLAGVPVLPALYGVYLLFVIGWARRRLRPVGLPGAAWSPMAVIVVVAVALSLDNFVTATPGTGFSLLVIGAISGVLALAGLGAGGAIVSGWPDRRRRIWLDAGLAIAVALAVFT